MRFALPYMPHAILAPTATAVALGRTGEVLVGKQDILGVLNFSRKFIIEHL